MNVGRCALQPVAPPPSTHPFRDRHRHLRLSSASSSGGPSICCCCQDVNTTALSVICLIVPSVATRHKSTERRGNACRRSGPEASATACSLVTPELPHITLHTYHCRNACSLNCTGSVGSVGSVGSHLPSGIEAMIFARSFTSMAAFGRSSGTCAQQRAIGSCAAFSCSSSGCQS